MTYMSLVVMIQLLQLPDASQPPGCPVSLACPTLDLRQGNVNVNSLRELEYDYECHALQEGVPALSLTQPSTLYPYPYP